MSEPHESKDPHGEPEPEVSGTVFLMATIGLWVIMYLKLIGR